RRMYSRHGRKKEKDKEKEKGSRQRETPEKRQMNRPERHNEVLVRLHTLAKIVSTSLLTASCTICSEPSACPTHILHSVTHLARCFGVPTLPTSLPPSQNWKK